MDPPVFSENPELDQDLNQAMDGLLQGYNGSAAPLVISTRGLYWLTNYVSSMCCLGTCCDITIKLANLTPHPLSGVNGFRQQDSKRRC